jgi:hypothetical protein
MTYKSTGIPNPLLNWASSNRQNIDPALLGPGLETTVAIILHGGIQRTFNTFGQSCDTLIAAQDDRVLLQMTPLAQISLLVTGVIQTVLSISALIFSLRWIYSNTVITPALRAFKDPCYFMTLISNSHMSTRLANMANAQSFIIWQNLDVTVRIGEEIGFYDNDMYGKLTMNLPRYVRPVKNGKTYF